MSALPSLLGAFHDAILAGDAAPVIPALKPNPHLPARKQFAIYSEGYRTRLAQAIHSDYPALLALLGEKEFDRRARAYIEAHPSRHFSLDRYPHGFAAFVHEQGSDAFAIDLAALEGAIAEVFMQAESEPLQASVLTGLTPEAFGGMRLKPRAASRLLAPAYPANAYMLAWREGHSPAAPAPEANFLYLVRHENEVRRHALTQAQYLVLAQLCAGQAIGDALECVMENYPALAAEIAKNLQRWFAAWTQGGFFQAAASGRKF